MGELPRDLPTNQMNEIEKLVIAWADGLSGIG